MALIKMFACNFRREHDNYNMWTLNQKWVNKIAYIYGVVVNIGTRKINQKQHNKRALVRLKIQKNMKYSVNFGERKITLNKGGNLYL